MLAGFDRRSYRNEIINTLGLVLYWRLSDAAIKDEASGRFPGTAIGTPVYTSSNLSGDPNNAMQLDGTTNAFSFTTTDMPFGAAARTFLFKAYFATGGANRIILAYGTNSTNQLIDLFHEDSSGKINNFTPSGGAIISQFVMLENVWYDVALTYDGTAWQQYTNGSPETPVSQTLGTTSGPFQYVGTTGGAGSYAGSLDEFAVFNRVLTYQEVYRLYRISHGS